GEVAKGTRAFLKKSPGSAAAKRGHDDPFRNFDLGAGWSRSPALVQARAATGGKPRPRRDDQLEVGAQLRGVVEETAVAMVADAGEREATLRNNAFQGGIRRRLPIVEPWRGESRNRQASRGGDDGHQGELGFVRPN